jgi:hypothetical protein
MHSVLIAIALLIGGCQIDVTTIDYVTVETGDVTVVIESEVE